MYTYRYRYMYTFIKKKDRVKCFYLYILETFVSIYRHLLISSDGSNGRQMNICPWSLVQKGLLSPTHKKIKKKSIVSFNSM